MTKNTRQLRYLVRRVAAWKQAPLSRPGLAVGLVRRLRGDIPVSELRRRGAIIGKGTYIGPGATLDLSFPWLISIGDDCTIAPDVRILTHDAAMKRHIGMTLVGRVNIGDRVYVGERAIILPDINIGDEAVIGAGSVVTRDVPSGTVVAGVPAKQIADVGRYLERHREELNRRPVWAMLGTSPDEVSAETRSEMRARLRDGPGYVP
jgi:maltose O-acetyltransferase